MEGGVFRPRLGGPEGPPPHGNTSELELERDADGATPEPEGPQSQIDSVVVVVEGSEETDVSTKTDVVAEESHQASADVEPEVVVVDAAEELTNIIHSGL